MPARSQARKNALLLVDGATGDPQHVHARGPGQVHRGRHLVVGRPVGSTGSIGYQPAPRQKTGTPLTDEPEAAVGPVRRRPSGTRPRPGRAPTPSTTARHRVAAAGRRGCAATTARPPSRWTVAGQPPPGRPRPPRRAARPGRPPAARPRGAAPSPADRRPGDRPGRRRPSPVPGPGPARMRPGTWPRTARTTTSTGAAGRRRDGPPRARPAPGSPPTRPGGRAAWSGTTAGSGC